MLGSCNDVPGSSPGPGSTPNAVSLHDIRGLVVVRCLRLMPSPCTPPVWPAPLPLHRTREAQAASKGDISAPAVKKQKSSSAAAWKAGVGYGHSGSGSTQVWSCCRPALG